MRATPSQVAAEVLALGGSALQSQVAAAFVDGVESDGDPEELADGVGPAQGLFQFEPQTWLGNGGGTYGPIAGDATWQEQVQVFVNASKGNNFGDWGPDLDPGASYGYSGPPVAGSKVANALAQLGPSFTNGVAASAPAGSGGGASPAASAASAGSNIVATENIPGYGNVGVTAQQESAYDTIEATFQAYGFSPSQVSTLTSWAWGEITNNVDPTQIALDLQTPGTTGYTVFEQVFPGFVQANQELVAQGLPAVSVANYAQYQTQAEAMARAAGLPPGFIDKNDIGQLIGHNVSTTELSNRLTDATALAYQSTAEQRNMFNQYFGTQYEHDTYIGEPGGTANNDTGHGPLTKGQIAALTLDPQKAEPLIHQQIAAAQIGGAGVTAGVGAISRPLALQLAQAGITDSQALSGFQQIGPLAPLEKALPGMGGEAKEGTVKPNQLAAAQFLGTSGATRAVQVAQEVRKAPFSGGGGFQINTRGSGVGPANNLGPVQQNE